MTEDKPKAQDQEVVQSVAEPKVKATGVDDEIQEMTTLHERTIAALSYAGPLAIIPFYLKKDSKFCRFHGKQGMLLFIIFFLGKLLTIIDVIMDLFLIIQVFFFFYMGMAALSGRWKKMPLFYKWSCEFEEALSLKTKQEEEEEEAMKPGETGAQEEPTKQ